MKLNTHFNRLEYTIYAIFTAILFVTPVVVMLYLQHTRPGYIFKFSVLCEVWLSILIFMIAFFIHDLLLAPILVYKRKPWLYVAGVILFAIAFMGFQCSRKPLTPGPPPPLPSTEKVQIAKDESTIIKGIRGVPPFETRMVMLFVIFMCGVGTNIGVKLYARSLSAHNRMEELEKENLEHNLKYLRYQIHPHFFMNTLNNIHALVDIDPKKAQKNIIDLSKLMRYVLYESDHQYVRASREEEFMANYVSLMRLRYGDKLDFRVNNNDAGTDICIPPLVFVSFVENAFKHGVCYNKPSFIHIKAERYNSEKGEERLNWVCRNSKHPKNGDTKVNESSGVGIPNIRHRLDLLFGDNYTLDFDDGEKEFCVTMDIPVMLCEECEDKNKDTKTKKQ